MKRYHVTIFAFVVFLILSILPAYASFAWYRVPLTGIYYGMDPWSLRKYGSDLLRNGDTLYYGSNTVQQEDVYCTHDSSYNTTVYGTFQTLKIIVSNYSYEGGEGEPVNHYYQKWVYVYTPDCPGGQLDFYDCGPCVYNYAYEMFFTELSVDDNGWGPWEWEWSTNSYLQDSRSISNRNLKVDFGTGESGVNPYFVGPLENAPPYNEPPAHIEASFVPEGNWTPNGTDWNLKIKREGSGTVREFEGSGTNVDIDWNGKDGQGDPVPGGEYIYQIEGECDSPDPDVFAIDDAGPLLVYVPAGDTRTGGEAIKVVGIKFEDTSPDPLNPINNEFELYDRSSGEAVADPVWAASYENNVFTVIKNCPAGYVRDKSGENGNPSHITVKADIKSDRTVPVNVRVKLWAELDGNSFLISSTMKDILIDTNHPWTAEDYDTLSFVTALLPPVVKKSNLSLHWSCSIAEDVEANVGIQNTQHVVYVTYDRPVDYTLADDGTPVAAKYPWIYYDAGTKAVVPDKSPLDMACTWAEGESVDTTIMAKLTQRIYTDTPKSYITDSEITTPPDYGMIFYLNRFFEPWDADCIAMADYLHVQGGSLGLNVSVMGIKGTGDDMLATKYVKPIQNVDALQARIYLNKWDPASGGIPSLSTHTWMQMGWENHYTGWYPSILGTVYEPTFKMYLGQVQANAQGVLNQRNAPQEKADLWGFQYQEPGDYAQYYGNPSGTFITGMTYDTYISHFIYEHESVEYNGHYFGYFPAPSISVTNYLPHISTQ